MEKLVDKEHLRILDQLYCINTVFVILSGDGQLLNIDPSRFYRSVYRLLNQLPFEKKPEIRKKQMIVVSKALDTMINERRKQLPLSRVAAFAKRLLAIATVMDDPSALCLVALVRSFFIRRHRSLSQIAQNILHSVPSTGPLKLNPQLTSIKPWVLMEHDIEEAGGYSQVDMKYMEDIQKYLKVHITFM
ncbi:hypothetical protein TELCIR_12470 [Teladorsagia circumcincta]|uniref:CCAAT-binding factor domain-containing protein n=1 Tax=Teladorsagia circumcincta TaxID=45464 RepID=A0A2G9U6E5_TELCI|nr:hypothetical protein TELCIR_12470 [Teladorsagia circumcincta]